jgi:hypothetical protein
MITRDDWLAALAAASPTDDPDALTITELSAVWGKSRSQTAALVKRLVATGRAARATKRINGVGGYARSVPAYRLIT